MDDGIKPSLSKMGASDRDLALLRKLLDKVIEKETETADAFAKAALSKGALDANEAAFKALVAQSTATMSLPQLQAHVAALKALNEEGVRLAAIHKANLEVAMRLKAESDQAGKESEAQKRKVRNASTVVRSDAEMRKQMSEKFKKDGIGDGHRLNVVFSRFDFDPAEKTPARSVTYFVTPDLILDLGTRMLLWPYTYVVVDLSAPVSSVAHEIVSAAGHVPPDAQKVFKGAEKAIRLKQSPGVIGRQPTKSMFDPDAWEDYDIPQYEEIPGGFFDGPENDIMNTGREDTDPDAIILRDPDKRTLLAAPFVIP